MKDLLIISLKYEEPYYLETLNCLERTKHDIVFADRQGVGNMSTAFNKAFLEAEAELHYKNVWFVTNIQFEVRVPELLLMELNSSRFQHEKISAIHPTFNSDHKHLRQYAGKTIGKIPFIEFTAPMINSKVYKEHLLDEELPYWGMDLDFSFRVKESGYNLGVHFGARIEHTYIRFNKELNSFTEKRKQLRAASDESTIKRLIQKYGNDWRKKLHYHG